MISQLVKLYERVVNQLNGTLYITADHGKAEEMYDIIATRQPRTAHTINKVPFLYITKNELGNATQLPLKNLLICPFILQKLGLPIPEAMQHKP